jgi:hypothetical protein
MNNYIENYNKFLEQLKIIFTDEETQNILNNISNDTEENNINKGKLFANLINDNFLNFVNCKIKIFSHKDEASLLLSESLFGSQLYLKNILNNQPDNVKAIIWKHLHTLWLSIENLKPIEKQNLENINIIKKELFKYNLNKAEAKTKLEELLGVNVNDKTTDMLDDIIDSFDEIINNTNVSNPLMNIMDISKKISDKYSDKITNGEIEINKIMESILKKIPGMEGIIPNLDSMSNIFNSSNNKKDNKIIIDDKFTTANIEVGQLEDKSNFKIGNILKVVDQFGIIPGGKSESTNNNQNEESINQSDQLEMIMNMLKKVNNSNNKDDILSLKEEMDTFLTKNLGIDVEKLNEQLKPLNEQFTSGEFLNSRESGVEQLLA